MQPLALTYRPKRFAEIIGQKPTRAVLAKIVGSGELPPAMIFAGVRGTGKTSMARITAKAINCETHRSFEPDGTCTSCLAIDAGGAPYYVEVDAASHSGADDMRQIVQDARYSAGGHWKVYVLDEVHSLSSKGFDVLLKTLEEPPPRTSFILVTTEPERIPKTIQTRSMYFGFAKITEADIAERLQVIAVAEGIEVSYMATVVIADRADGGMRDAIMTLDQLSKLEVPITPELITGLYGEDSVKEWITALRSGNPARAVLVADELVGRYGSVGAMIDKALLVLRDVLLAKEGHREMPLDAPESMSTGQALELIRKLWKLRVQVKRLGPDDRAAVVALSAELVRGVERPEGGAVAVTDEALAEVFKVAEVFGGDSKR